MGPECNSKRTRPGRVEPEIYFRIVHVAREGHNCGPVAAYREQTVEIALGPKGAFENGNIGTLRRRAPPDQVLSAVPPGRGNPKQPREPKTCAFRRFRPPEPRLNRPAFREDSGHPRSVSDAGGYCFSQWPISVNLCCPFFFRKDSPRRAIL